MRSLLAMAIALAASLFNAPASAADLSFVGSFADPNNVQIFRFVVRSSSNVTLRSWSYAGGVNTQGGTIAQGGFDPTLTLFDSTGNEIGRNDDDRTGTVAPDAATGARFDVYLSRLLDPGNYSFSIQAYPNFAIGPKLASGFSGGGTFNDAATGDLRSKQWAVDVLGVTSATQVAAVPEPMIWTMMILGFGFIGFAMRRRNAHSAANLALAA